MHCSTFYNKRQPDVITLVISPLTSLVDDQIDCLTKWNFRCAKISALSDMEQNTVADIKEGKYQIVFSFPESALKPYWRDAFLSRAWQTNLRLIAVDEAHCISEWGPDFREDFRRLYELRSFFQVPIMALTATCSKAIKTDSMKCLHLTEDITAVIHKIPDRPNIFIYTMKRESTDYLLSLKWLIDHIRDKGPLSKKCVIYCRSIDTVSEIFLTLRECLELNAYANRVKQADNLLIEMYHKSTHELSKERIMKIFKDKESVIKCVVSTIAIGHGCRFERCGHCRSHRLP